MWTPKSIKNQQQIASKRAMENNTQQERKKHRFVTTPALKNNKNQAKQLYIVYLYGFHACSQRTKIDSKITSKTKPKPSRVHLRTINVADNCCV